MTTRMRIAALALIGNAALLVAGVAIGSRATVAFAVVGAITGSAYIAMNIRDLRRKETTR